MALTFDGDDESDHRLPGELPTSLRRRWSSLSPPSSPLPPSPLCPSLLLCFFSHPLPSLFSCSSHAPLRARLAADPSLAAPNKKCGDQRIEPDGDMGRNLEKISEKIDCIIARLMHGCKVKPNVEGIDVNATLDAVDGSLSEEPISSRTLEDHVDKVIQRLSERKVHCRSKSTCVFAGDSSSNNNHSITTPRKCLASVMKDKGDENAENGFASSTPRSASSATAGLIPQKAASDGRHRSTTPSRVPTLLTPRSLLSKFAASDEVRSPSFFAKSSSCDRKEKPSGRRLALAFSFLASSPRSSYVES